MKTFSLPQKFFERLCALNDRLAVKVYKAMAEYIYSDGQDNTIDTIYSPDARDLIADFKVFADKKFATRERARQRRQERKNRPKPKRPCDSTRYITGLSYADMKMKLHVNYHFDEIFRLPYERIPELFNMVFCRFTPPDLIPGIITDYLQRYVYSPDTKHGNISTI